MTRLDLQLALEAGSDRDPDPDDRKQVSFLEVAAAVMRRSLVMCSVGARNDGCGSSVDIGWPTDVRHIAHVTFDRFHGFLGLPVELQPEVPTRAPSASANVFGVSAQYMQCSYDQRGNSVPTILLLMQKQLYLRGGLNTEGIFRINAENGQELYVRNQLNKGIVPQGVDSHCLAGLIKAWFRELPTGVLDCLTPEQVMHCNNEEDCSNLVSQLPPTEAALLDWAINLMADVVEHECINKMNARNIAMVFAPNMTQMADPLTALIHAVQVMNFLKTLIVKTLRDREEAAVEAAFLNNCSESPNAMDDICSSDQSCKVAGEMSEKGRDQLFERASLGKHIQRSKQGSQSDTGESFHSFGEKSDLDDNPLYTSKNSSPAISERSASGNSNGYFDRNDTLFGKLSLRVRKVCLHPVLQLNRSFKRSRDHSDVNSR